MVRFTHREVNDLMDLLKSLKKEVSALVGAKNNEMVNTILNEAIDGDGQVCQVCENWAPASLIETESFEVVNTCFGCMKD